MVDQWLVATNSALALARQHLIAAAEAQNQEIIRRDRPSSYLRTIEGVAAATEVAFRVYQVARAGQTIYRTVTRITYRYEYMDDVVQFALQTLRSRSPVGGDDDRHAGLYRDGHRVFIDGRLVQDAKDWQPGQIVHLSNAVPYSRKIEAGRMKMSVPPHVYETTVDIVAARFGNSAKVTMTYMPVRFGSIEAYSQSASGRALARRVRRGRPAFHSEWLARQPALEITAR